MKTTTLLIKHTDKTWYPISVHCSPSSGDLLIGMCRRYTDTHKVTFTGKVMRYDNTGKYKQTIPHDNNTPHRLYKSPWFITEHNNGDVVVSDYYGHAVVVTSGEGVHRLSYTGPPSGSGLFNPRGICTDVMSHILVSDSSYPGTVQMMDRDGQFLFYVLTRQTPGMDSSPWGLSYDVTTHAVCVGSWDDNTMSVCRHINRHLNLTGNETIKKVSKQKKKSKTGTCLGPQLTLSPEPDQDPKGNLMILEVNRGCVICVHCQRNPICTSKS